MENVEENFKNEVLLTKSMIDRKWTKKLLECRPL